jgi:hypothetical protein
MNVLGDKFDIHILLQHAVMFVNGEQYYGAKASINVWTPRVTDQYEFSLSQIWVIAGSFGNDLNTIEAGWQACSNLFSKLLFYFCYFLVIKSYRMLNFCY